MKKWKKFDLKQIDWRPLIRSRWFWFTIVSVLSLAAALDCMAGFRHTGILLRSQQAALEWAGAGETPYAQISAFLPEGSALDEAGIRKFHEKLDADLPDLVTEDVRNLYCDAWSTRGSTSIVGPNGSSDASVTAVGGNFFQLHPQNLLSGGYLSEDDLMHDRVILDEELAWKLFGGYDLSGMTVTIAGREFQVAGVIARETDPYHTAAYTDGAGLYLSYDTWTEMNESAHISCYEIVMPEPVDGYAQQRVTDDLGVKNAVIVNNTTRYSAGSIFSLLRNFGTRSMHTEAVSYPYWENAARLVENRCVIWMLLAILFWICPVICVVVLTVKAYRKARKKIHNTYLDLKDQYENRVLWDNLKAKWKGIKHGRSDAETH